MAQTVQILRTHSNTSPPLLLAGALSVELGTQTKLWVGDGTGNRLLVSSDPNDQAPPAFLPLNGGQMAGAAGFIPGSPPNASIYFGTGNTTTGLYGNANLVGILSGGQARFTVDNTVISAALPVTLPGAPTLPAHAATKAYVDGLDASQKTYVDAADALKLPLAGGTLTGPLVLAGPPTVALNPASKAYVDAAASSALNNVGRNLIHNPLFNIAQRGVGPFTVNSVHTADRWPLGFSGGTMTVNVAAVSDADRTSIGDEAATNNLSVAVVGGSGAGDETYMEHRLEGVRRTAGKTVTLSFYAKASVASQKIGSFLYQSFGTGGSPSGIVIIAGQAVTISTTYARYSMTFTIPSVVGKTFGTNNNDFLDLRLGLSAGATSGANYGGVGVQSATFQIWGVQLEIGGTMTPLEKPDPQQDLANCRRFFILEQFNVGQYAGATGTWMNLFFPQTMRVQPTVTLSSLVYTNGSSASVNSAQRSGALLVMTTTAGQNSVLNGNYSASADL